MTPEEVAAGVRTGLDQYAQVDSVTLQPETTSGGKKIINVNMVGGIAPLAVELDPANDGVLVYGTPDGGTTQEPLDTDNGVAGTGTLRVVPDDFTGTTLTNVETFTDATWQALGKATTTVVDDGDLQTVDTEAKALAVNPTDNAAGAASVKYSIAFLLRWSVSLFQSIVNSLRPSASSAYAITPYISAAQEASAVVKASAGNLYGFVFTNNNAATRYVQVFNAAALPGDGAVPALSFPVSPGAVLPFDTGAYPNQFTNGIVVCNSTTQATKTIGAADSLFYVQYK